FHPARESADEPLAHHTSSSAAHPSHRTWPLALLTGLGLLASAHPDPHPAHATETRHHARKSPAGILRFHRRPERRQLLLQVANLWLQVALAFFQPADLLGGVFLGENVPARGFRLVPRRRRIGVAAPLPRDDPAANGHARDRDDGRDQLRL